MQEHNVEVRIGHDDDGRWWTIVFVDDDEALRRGPFADQADAEGAGLELAGEIRNLDDEGMRLFIAEKGLPTRH
jgi:hypothetical protein